MGPTSGRLRVIEDGGSTEEIRKAAEALTAGPKKRS